MKYRVKEKLKYRVKNVALWIFIVLVFLAFAPAIVWVDRQQMFEIVDALAVGLAIGALIRWLPSAVKALLPPIHDLRSADYLVTGLAMVSVGGAARLAGQWFWRANDKPNWWIDSTLLLYCTITIAIGFFLLLIPTYSDHGGALRNDAYPKTLLLTLVSFAIGAALIWVSWGSP